MPTLTGTPDRDERPAERSLPLTLLDAAALVDRIADALAELAALPAAGGAR